MTRSTSSARPVTMMIGAGTIDLEPVADVPLGDVNVELTIPDGAPPGRLRGAGQMIQAQRALGLPLAVSAIGSQLSAISTVCSRLPS
jgi:hypothetical protein